MDVRLCKGCKKMFQYVAGPELCPKCKLLEEDMFQVVKDYLRKNPGANMHVVSKETEVPVATIERFLRQDRLQVAEGSPISIRCEMCGADIKSGRYCNACERELNMGLSALKKSFVPPEVKKEEREEPKERMRFLRSDRIR